MLSKKNGQAGNCMFILPLKMNDGIGDIHTPRQAIEVVMLNPTVE